MDIRHLRTFVTVAEQGTVSKAALRLRITQPALSRQIMDLEQELGLKLFDRVAGRLLLTSEGQQLLGDCRVILGQLASLGERAKLLRRGDTGLLKVAASPQQMEAVLPTFLHRYAKRYPNVKVEFIEAVGPDILTLVERGEVHLGISLMRAVQADTIRFASYRLAAVEFLAAVGRRLRLDKRQDRHKRPRAISVAFARRRLRGSKDVRCCVSSSRTGAEHSVREPRAAYLAGARGGRARRGHHSVGRTHPSLRFAACAHNAPAQAVTGAGGRHMG